MYNNVKRSTTERI